MFEIRDWANNLMFDSQAFNTFEDAWEFIYSQGHLTEDDYQDIFVERVKTS